VRFREIVRFCAVGFVTALIYFFVIGFLYDVMKWGYLFAVTLAFIFSTAFHFLANRSYTFNSHSRSIARQLFRYIVLIVINYLITILIVKYFVEILDLHPYLGVLMSTFLTVMVGYMLSNFWVFNERGVD